MKASNTGTSDCGNINKQFSEDAVMECLKVLESGDTDSLFELLPRIGVMRDPHFYPYLLALLKHKEVRRREFAACAMGATADESFLEPLKAAFIKTLRPGNDGGYELQTAIIEAIGALGDDNAVDFLLPELMKNCEPADGGKKSGDAGIRRWIIGAIGAIAQQGRPRSLAALVELAVNEDQGIQIMALAELSGAYWHRPNDISDEVLREVYGLTAGGKSAVAKAALAVLQNLADVGCMRAEALFRREP